MTEQQPDPTTSPYGDEGAEGDSSAKDRLPGAPAPDDDTPLGDTDQHSDAYGEDEEREVGGG